MRKMTFTEDEPKNIPSIKTDCEHPWYCVQTNRHNDAWDIGSYNLDKAYEMGVELANDDETDNFTICAINESTNFCESTCVVDL